MAVCNSTNTVGYEDESFFDFSAGTWSPHKIGWTVSGVCALLTTLITFISLTRHAMNYQIPAQQRQVGRIALMPLVYAICSFLGYRWYRHSVYFELIETAFEGITLAAFLLLLVEFVSSSATNGDIKESMARKDKQGLPMTFGRIRFRASKPYFVHTLKWSVLQYAFFRPLLSIISIICEAFDKLCPEVYSPYFAEVYLEAFDFLVISIALYGLVVWYVLTKDELKGRQPLNKFMSLKCIIFATFYQSFIFSALAGHGVLKATTYWTVTNIADGLNALCLSVEMVFFAIWMAFAFPPKEYVGNKPRSFKNYLRFIRDVCWLGDFGMELWTASVFFWDYMRGRPGTHSGGFNDRLEKAFGATSDEQSIPLTISPGSSRKGDSSSGPYAEIGEEQKGGSGRDAEGTWH